MLWVPKWRGGKRGGKRRRKKKDTYLPIRRDDEIDKARISISAYEQEESGGKIIKTRCGYLFALVMLIICSELRVLSGVHRCVAVVGL